MNDSNNNGDINELNDTFRFFNNIFNEVSYNNLKEKIIKDIEIYIKSQINEKFEVFKNEIKDMENVLSKSPKISQQIENEHLNDHLIHEIKYLKKEIDNKNETIKSLIDLLKTKSCNENPSIGIHGVNVTKPNSPQVSNSHNITPCKATSTLEETMASPKTMSSKRTSKSKMGQNKPTIQKIKEVKQQVIICGDSIIKGLDNNRASTENCCISFHPLSGGNSFEMIDFVKPLARRNPDKMVIHAGSNDLTVKEGMNTIDNLKKVHAVIKNINPKCEVIFSESSGKTKKK